MTDTVNTARKGNRNGSDRLTKLSVVSVAVQVIALLSLFLTSLLTVSLMQLSGKFTIDVFLGNLATNSDKLVFVDAFDKNMANIDERVSRVMIFYFIDNAFSINFSHDESLRRVRAGGELYNLAARDVWEKIFKVVEKRFVEANLSSSGITVHPQVKSIVKVANSLWQAEVDMRTYDMALDKLTIETYVMNIRAFYLPWRAKMTFSFKNPLGFTVTEFNMSKVGVDLGS